MAADSPVDRRTLLRLALGTAAGGVAGGQALADRRAGSAPADGDCERTPKEIMGPFYPIREQDDKDVDLTRVAGREGRAEGEVIRVHGRVIDDDCSPVAGAMVEIWQANKHGRYSHERDPNPAPLDANFQGWAQIVTGDDGGYAFTTIKPGAYPVNPQMTRTPHIHFRVARRGYHEQITQMYFAGEELNATDYYVQRMAAAERARVVVEPLQQGGETVYHFEVTLKRFQSGVVDVAVLDEYVGDYDLAYKGTLLEQMITTLRGLEDLDALVLKIDREGEKLYAQARIQPRVELEALSPERFSFKALDAEITFQRDAGGKVEGLTLHWHFEHPDTIARKIR